MMSKSITARISFLILVALFVSVKSGHATHIRAGEITAELISCQNFSYRFFITGYTDTGSDVLFGGGEIKYGDGTTDTFETGNPEIFEDLGDEIALNIFIKEHTFPGPGVYKISFREFNRNEGIANMDNSVNTPFYIETVLVIDPFFGCNETPVLTNPPIDRACIGVAFLHNAGAVDPDGDSLSYEFTIPKMDQDIPVVNYRYPNVHDIAVYDARNEEMTGAASFDIDPITGDLVWDAPGGEGEYNMAFVVKEWRKIEGEWYNIGYVTRDMQVIVEDCDNERPEIFPPPDTCVVAGSQLQVDVFAEDPDGHNLIFESFGEPFEILNSPASYTPFPPSSQPSPATLTFSWNTNCNHIRQQPYQVRFKATDQPPVGEGPKLADFATWFVTIVGPPPEGLAANQGNGNFVNLSWDPYLCGNASSMEIWRRVDSNPFEPDHCELGMPENAGYELIDIVDINTDNYRDNNNGLGLEYGANYCYRLVAVFESLDGMKSIVSAEACVELVEIDGKFGSLTTNVSVETTDTDNGEIFVRWTSPFDIDPAVFPAPYTYELYRGQGFSSASYELISGGRIADTTFTDTGLNTTDQVYNYIVRVFDGNLNPIDTTLSASSVRLEPSPLAGAMELSWSAQVPWSNVAANYPSHLVYRDNVDPGDPDLLVLIDSVNVLQNGLTYLDDGSATGENGLRDTQEYCYYIITRGVYGNDKISEPLVNRSQIVCAQPNDTVPPCPPLALEIANSPDCETFLMDKPCDYDEFFNDIEWEVNTDPGCDDDVRSYNIYFSPSGLEEDFTLIDNVTSTFYTHFNLPSFKGCYRITAIDRSGNESEPSQVVCNDNCPNYELPNVFTPNSDGYNDTFQAYNIAIPDETGGNVFNCPRFVISVEFSVYNRYGKLVYSNIQEPEQGILINWDGQTNEGTTVSTGVYYYLAKVIFDVLDPGQQRQDIKGWVQVLK